MVVNGLSRLDARDALGSDRCLDLPDCALQRNRASQCSLNTAPRHLLRDRDRIYGETFQERIKSLNIESMVTAPRSPWQNPFVERMIGSIR